MRKNKSCFTFKKCRGLYYWGKFLGINPLCWSKNNELVYSYRSLVYCCFLSLLYCHSFYWTLMSQSKILLRKETPMAVIVDFSGVTWQCLEILSTWLVSAVFQNRLKNIFMSFMRAEEISSELGISENLDELYKQFRLHVILNNIIYIVSILASNIMWSFFNDYDIFLWTRFDMLAIASLNGRVLFIWSLMLVRRKFRKLNRTVQSFMENARANESNEGTSGLIRCESKILLDRIIMISQLHRELRNIIYRMERHFATFVLFTVGNSLSCITLNCYGIYRDARGHPRQLPKDLLYVGAAIHWIFYPVAMLTLLSNVCGSITDEANHTGSVLHEFINGCENFRHVRAYAELNSLSLDLLNNRVSMSILGLFELDHFFVFRALRTAATYLIIMLQLYE